MNTLKFVYEEDGDAIRIVDDTLQLRMSQHQQQQQQQQRQPTVEFVTVTLKNRPNGRKEVLTVDVVKKKYNVTVAGKLREVMV